MKTRVIYLTLILLIPVVILTCIIPAYAIGTADIVQSTPPDESGNSGYVVSDLPGHKLAVNVTCIISLSTGGNPDGTIVSLNSQEEPFTEYSLIVPQSGVVIFEGITEGSYLVGAVKAGFYDYSAIITINADCTIEIVLLEHRYKPVNLSVNNQSLVADWEEPIDVLINEDFEGLEFPPAGWQALTQSSQGWYRTSEGSTPRFPIPPHTMYAVTSDNSPNNNGCCDYLITPSINLTNLTSYKLTLSSCFSGAFNQHAFIHISTDGGSTWNPLMTLVPSPGLWQEHELDLSLYSGTEGFSNVKIAFHADDYNDWASGWAIDNVRIFSENISLQGYGLFLDGILIGNTSETNFTFTDLNYGQQYLAGVAALYSSGYSETDTFSFTSHFLRPPRNLRGIMPDLTDYVHLWWDQPDSVDTAGSNMQGLLGYNVFRNNNLIAFTEYPLTEYNDLNLQPGTYSYHITAVYDLSTYGLPYETGESMIEGPVELTYLWSYHLPFNESFNTGLFETNQWSVEGNNWRIAGQIGNPAPSAEFYLNPAATNYSFALNSMLMNGAGYIDGKIMLEYSIRHNLVNSTGAEFLAVEVFDGHFWNQVAEFDNSANLDWTTKSINITGYAMGNLFRVRFRAHGNNSHDIFNWLIDNVSIYRVCAPPVNLDAHVNFPFYTQSVLNWEAPEGGGGGSSGWLGWDKGTNNDAIGLTSGGTFSIAARFTPAQLGQYAGTSLTRLRFFPYAAGTFVLKVWTGSNAGQLVVAQTVASVSVGQWNEVALNTPVPVTGASELWFGYTVTHASGAYPAGTDAGPAVVGFGDMISLDGSVWESMATQYALNYNWNMNGYVETIDGVTALQPISDNTVYGPVSQLVRGNLPMSPHHAVTNSIIKTSRMLSRYNVWRKANNNNFEIIASTTETTFVDLNMQPGVLNCYFVTAVYEDCESMSSNEDCVFVGINKLNIPDSRIHIYPNPSNCIANVECSSTIRQIKIYNPFGQVVYQQVVAGAKEIQINVKNYKPGVYQVMLIDWEGECFFGKLLIAQ